VSRVSQKEKKKQKQQELLAYIAGLKAAYSLSETQGLAQQDICIFGRTLLEIDWEKGTLRRLPPWTPVLEEGTKRVADP
jgi:hypothetical protein